MITKRRLRKLLARERAIAVEKHRAAIFEGEQKYWMGRLTAVERISSAVEGVEAVR